jgi:LysM repeat protein
VSILPASTWGRIVRPNAPRMRDGQVTEMTVHYTGAPRVGRSPDQIAAFIKSIERNHLGRGPSMSAVGYNFAIDKFGRIWELRGWDYKNAANGTSSNNYSFSVCLLIGVEDNQPTNEMIRALQELYRLGCERFKRRLAVKGHQEHKPTACPGPAIMALIRANTIQAGVNQQGQVPTPTPPPAPPAQPTPEKPVDPALPDQAQIGEYTVQRGDSWWKISQQVLGKGSRWKELFELNGSPRTLIPGQVLKVPGFTNLYQVVSGDSYWKIAKKMLGSGSRWKEISRLNDNKTLRPGTTIRLPEE